MYYWFHYTRRDCRQQHLASTKCTNGTQSYNTIDVYVDHILVDSGAATQAMIVPRTMQHSCLWNPFHHNSSQLQMIQSKSTALDVCAINVKDNQLLRVMWSIQTYQCQDWLTEATTSTWASTGTTDTWRRMDNTWKYRQSLHQKDTSSATSYNNSRSTKSS